MLYYEHAKNKRPLNEFMVDETIDNYPMFEDNDKSVHEKYI